MSATRFNFVFLAGDGSVGQQFTALNPDGTLMDLSTASEISFAVRRTLADPVLLIKLKSTGGITIVNAPGTDGKFLVTLLSADTLALTGFYLYQCVVTKAGLATTVVIGNVQAGPAPAWSYSGDPESSDKDAVRWLVGDVISNDPQIFDPEVLFSLKIRSSIFGAAADCCRALAGKLSRVADSVQGDLKIMYSARARAYRLLAAEYENRAIARGGAMPYAGGISITDKMLQENNLDRVTPQFNLGMTDNWLPIAPSGNETYTNPPMSGTSPV